MTIFPRKIKQGGQHLGGQLNRHPIDPIKGLADRQTVQDRADPLTDEHLKILQPPRRNRRRRRPPLHIMLGRVHGDEVQGRKALRIVANDNVAVRRKDLMVGVHRHNVMEPGNRPKGPKLALRRIVDRGLLAQPLEKFQMRAILKQLRPTGVQALQRQAPRINRSLRLRR